MRIPIINHITALQIMLEKIFRHVENVEHIGDYKFRAKVGLWDITVYTEPTGKDTIDIMDIRFEDAN